MEFTMSGAVASGHFFPVLKPDDILKCLNDIGLEMSMEELTEPHRHKEKLRHMFLQVLEFCRGKTEEDIQPSAYMVAKAKTMPYPEIHEDMAEMKFFYALRELFEICGYTSFSWRDLHAPTPKRLRLQLSAILNLAKYRDEQLKVYQELNEPRAMIVQNLEELNKENIDLTRQLQDMELESKSNYLQMEELERECQELELEIARNNKLQASAREEAAELKKKATDLKDELASATWALQESEAEEEQLRLQVVSSPDRRKKELVAKRQALDGEKKECAALDSEIQDCKKKILKLKDGTKDLESCTNALDELKQVTAAYSEISQLRETSKVKIQSIEKKTYDFVKATDEAERRLHRAEEKIIYQRKQHQIEMQALQDALDSAKKQLLLVEKDRRDGMARVEAGEAEVRNLEAAIERARLQTEDEIKRMIEEYQETELIYLERNEMRMGFLQRSVNDEE